MAMIDIKDMVAMLAAQAEAVCRAVLPGGRRIGHEWKCSGNTYGAGESLGVCLTGPKAGIWCNFISGERGDILALVAQIACGGDMKEAVRWARGFLGIDDAGPGGALRIAPRLAAVKMVADENDAAEIAKVRARALELYKSGAALMGSPASAYLTGRRIQADLLPEITALRFHPEVWSSEAGRKLPAMLAGIFDANAKFMAVHRTFLEIGPGDAVRKARLKHPKMSWGRYAGGFIPLRMRKSRVLVLTEGIENALSVAPFTGDASVAAAVSLSNLARILPPPRTREVLVVADNDAGNAVARQALVRALRHYADLGLKVRVAHPPAGVKDANDLLTHTNKNEGAA